MKRGYESSPAQRDPRIAAQWAKSRDALQREEQELRTASRRPDELSFGSDRGASRLHLPPLIRGGGGSHRLFFYSMIYDFPDGASLFSATASRKRIPSAIRLRHALIGPKHIFQVAAILSGMSLWKYAPNVTRDSC